MQTLHTDLPGVYLLTPRRFGDERGWFSEVWSMRRLEDAGIKVDFVQDNHSFSADVGTLRGLHYQSPPRAQDKLVRVGRGRVFDVAVDVRRGSPNYGRWVGVELSAERGEQLFIPKGFLHGFVTLEPNTEFLYKCSDYYAPECDGAVAWDDPEIGIDWPIAPARIRTSAKDREAQSLAEFVSPFEFDQAGDLR